jgi:hypothetical protein
VFLSASGENPPNQYIYIYVCCCFAVIIPCYILVNITATYEKEHEAPTSEMPPEAATENVMLSLGKF